MNLTDIPIGIGTWFLGEDRRKRNSEIAAIRRGLDLGLRVVDTAEMYGSGASEELVGEAIAGRRDDVFLVSKVLPSNASASGVRRALEASLYRLNTDRLDLYLYHWRGHHRLEETVEALQAAVDDGLIGAWGVSNFDPADMDDLADLGVTPATNQILYNLLRRGPEYDLLPLMRERGVDHGLLAARTGAALPGPGRKAPVRDRRRGGNDAGGPRPRVGGARTGIDRNPPDLFPRTHGGKRLRPPGDAHPGDPARPRRGVHAAVRAPPARNSLIRELSALRGCGRRSHPF